MYQKTRLKDAPKTPPGLFQGRLKHPKNAQWHFLEDLGPLFLVFKSVPTAFFGKKISNKLSILVA
jgi:hypothetical protein